MVKEIKIELGTKLDDVIRILREYKENGENVWCVFNDYKLTSNDSLCEIYVKVFGFSQKMYGDKSEELGIEYLLEKEKRELAISYNLSFWIREGKRIIDSSKHIEWEECVKFFSNCDCYYLVIDDALDIMYELEAGSSLSDVKEIFISQELSGNSAFIVKNLVYIFSKRGREFYDLVSNYTVLENHVKKLVK